MHCWCGVFNLNTADGHQVGVSTTNESLFVCRVPDGQDEQELSDIYGVEWNGKRTRIMTRTSDVIVLHSDNNENHERLHKKVLAVQIQTPGDASQEMISEIFTPAMPPFLPGVRPDHSDVMLDHPKSPCKSEKQYALTAATEDFWHFFVAVLEVNKHSRDKPHFVVKLQGDSEPGLEVNSDFVESYVAGWHQLNPFVVIVTTSCGIDKISFRCSEQFVLFVREQIHSSIQEDDQKNQFVNISMIITHPKDAPVWRYSYKTTLSTWNDLAASWERSQNTTAQHRVQLLTCIHTGAPVPTSLLYGGDSVDGNQPQFTYQRVQQPVYPSVQSSTAARQSNDRYWVNFIDEWEIAERGGW